MQEGLAPELINPLKNSQQYALRIKNFVNQREDALILRSLKCEIPVAWNLKYSFSTGC